MKTIHLHLLLFFNLLISPCWAQISGVQNLYVKVTTVHSDCGHLTVTSSTGYNPGDRVLIIQMKGATMNTTATASYGNLTTLNNAGGYEFNYISSISGNEIYLLNTLNNTYDAVNGCVQLIQVPVYNNVTINGTVTALPWDGSIGGVVAIEVTGTLTMTAGINVSGQGFRGGTFNPGVSTACNAGEYSIASTSARGGRKGEGIVVTATGYESGRGKQVNGGGSGMSNNSGGGGGSNAGAGGAGGKETIPQTFCGNSNMGHGGIALTYSNAAGRVFLGGGGGGGHQNNFTGAGPAGGQAGATEGANGGGIVIIKADKIDGGLQVIEANGLEPAYRAIGDSGGGAGGGGAVLISYNTLLSGFTVNANGGKGGDVDTDRDDRQLGPGGGGGGGVFWSSQPLTPAIVVSTAGGIKGICGYYIWPAAIYTLWAPALQTASDGSAGISITGLSLNESTGTCSPLPVSLLYFRAQQQGHAVTLNWFSVWEKDNDAFIVQRSEDGVNYYTLNEVKPGGCQLNCPYTYTDYTATAGKYYYRLKQRDLDGTITIVGSATIELNSEVLAQLVYPQPASDVLHVELKDDLPVSLKFTDVMGREYPIQYTQQEHLLTIQLNVAPGLYTLSVANQEHAETVKVIVK